MSNITNKEEFIDVKSSEIIEVLVNYPLVILDTRSGRFVFSVKLQSSRRALSQMLNLLDIKYRDFVELMRRDPEQARELLIERMRPDLVISARLSSDGLVYVPYRVTTVDFSPVKHELLFEYVEGILSDAGIAIREKKFLNFRVRKGYAYILGTGKIKLRYAEIYKWGIAVTNSNIGMKAIHIYGYFEFEGCSNQIIIPSVHIVHRGELESVLLRVKKAVEVVLEKVANTYIPQLHEAVVRLSNLPITEDTIRVWLQLIAKRYGKKYARYLENVLKKYTKRYGYNKYALLQAITEVSTRSKALTLKEYLNKEAVKLIAEAVGGEYRSKGM